MSQVRRYLGNVLWSWSGVVVTVAIAFLLSPYVIRTIGDSDFGVWTVALSLVEYYALMDLGFRSATIKMSAEFRATGDTAKLNELLSTGVLYASMAGTVILTGTMILAPYLAHAFKSDRPELIMLIRVVGASWALGMAFNVLSACLEGFQRFDLTTRVWLTSMILRSAGILTLLLLGYGVLGMGYMLLAAQCTGYVLTYVLFRRAVPEARLSWRRATRPMLKSMFDYGIHTFTTSISQLLLGRAVPLLIPTMLPLRFVTYYAVPVRILDYVAELFGRIGSVTAPNASELLARGRSKDLVWLGIYTNRYSFLIFAPAAIFLLTYGFEVYSLWIRPDFARECAYLLPVLVVGYVVMSGQANSVSILFGIGRHKIYSRCLLAEALLMVAGILAVTPQYGLYGVVWVTTTLMTLNRGIIVCWLVSRELKIDPLTYAAQIYGVPLLLSGATWLCLAWAKTYWLPGKSWRQLIGAGVLMSAVYAPLAFRFCIAEHHRQHAFDVVREKLSLLTAH